MQYLYDKTRFIYHNQTSLQHFREIT